MQSIVFPTAFAALVLAAAPATAQTITRTSGSPAIARSDTTRVSMNITRAGSQPSTKGPADWFTGTVRIDPLFTAPAPGRVAGTTVTFEPGARTAWHRHPLGQTLVVLSGLGRVQREGSEIEEIRPGDVVWIPPNERHWHGASPATAMSHIAILESLDGKVVDWFEHVTDEQYAARPRAR
jgi:quercetin dioxygenase-like cupin family protein